MHAVSSRGDVSATIDDGSAALKSQSRKELRLPINEFFEYRRYKY
jgi:hypothetical protein